MVGTTEALSATEWARWLQPTRYHPHRTSARSERYTQAELPDSEKGMAGLPKHTQKRGQLRDREIDWACGEASLDPLPLAALLLYGEPFGFTHDDVRLLRSDAPDAGELRRLADRIAALLPPDE